MQTETATVTPEAVSSFTAAAKAAGLSDEQVQVTLGKHGVTAPAPPAATPTTPVLPSQSSEASAQENATFAPFTADQYDLDGVYTSRQLEGDLTAVDRDMRGALAALEVPKLMAKGIAELVLDAEAKYKTLTSDIQRKMYTQESCYTVARVLGTDIEAAMKIASKAFARLPEATRTA